MSGFQRLSRVVFGLAWVVAAGWADAQTLPKTPGQVRAEEAEARAKEEQRKREQAGKQAEAAEARARRLQEELDRERKRAQEAEKAAKAAAAAAPARSAVQPAAAQSARPAPGSVLKDCDVCPPLVVLPRGRFPMGSPARAPGRQPGEGPQRVVSIDYDLAVGRFEVTQREWTAVMGSNPSFFKGCD
ncbi:MAG: SUMF1/EgtB/PvdO family nonheme iron enzyme, partial [Betaproteobacteria bacterium]